MRFLRHWSAPPRYPPRQSQRRRPRTHPQMSPTWTDPCSTPCESGRRRSTGSSSACPGRVIPHARAPSRGHATRAGSRRPREGARTASESALRTESECLESISPRVNRRHVRMISESDRKASQLAGLTTPMRNERRDHFFPQLNSCQHQVVGHGHNALALNGRNE